MYLTRSVYSPIKLNFLPSPPPLYSQIYQGKIRISFPNLNNKNNRIYTIHPYIIIFFKVGEQGPNDPSEETLEIYRNYVNMFKNSS